MCVYIYIYKATEKNTGLFLTESMLLTRLDGGSGLVWRVSTIGGWFGWIGDGGCGRSRSWLVAARFCLSFVWTLVGSAYIFNTVRPGRSSSARRRWVMDTRMNRMFYRGFYACTCCVCGGGDSGCGSGSGNCGSTRGSGWGFDVMKGAIGGSCGCEEG